MSPPYQTIGFLKKKIKRKIGEVTKDYNVFIGPTPFPTPVRVERESQFSVATRDLKRARTECMIAQGFYPREWEVVASPEELRENQFHTCLEDSIGMTGMRHVYNPTSSRYYKRREEEKESRKRLDKITPSLDYTTTKVESLRSFVREVNKGHEQFLANWFSERGASPY